MLAEVSGDYGVSATGFSIDIAGDTASPAACPTLHPGSRSVICVTARRLRFGHPAVMLGEHSQTADNGWRERCRRAKLEFLITELQTGHVFASLAITSTNPANVVRYRHLAREAYDTVMRFWPTLPLHIDEHKRLGVGLASLESKIEELAHPRREVSNSDGITADETNAPAFRLAFRP